MSGPGGLSPPGLLSTTCRGMDKRYVAGFISPNSGFDSPSRYQYATKESIPLTLWIGNVAETLAALSEKT